MKGLKTYTGIGVLAIGAFGLSNYIAPSEWETLVKLLFEVVGLVMAVYGRIVTQRDNYSI